MNLKIREIQEKDNTQIEKIIRNCLIEFGGNREGLAWADPCLSKLSEEYKTEGNKYWVIVDEKDNVLGGCGIGEREIERVCELQKMYCVQEIRGTGIAKKLMNIALEYAKKYYDTCYIETLSNMIAANKFYQKYGFKKLDEPLIKTEHYACDVWYMKKLN
ncbi:MAG TPA: GNAT family N-acetyltransferase [Candidatus Scatovivens faecipullorum]|nr:GNAT family N-acetyltransferase [Candidatus Scatovivens faecipullorum]